jgi:hypothetical protein
MSSTSEIEEPVIYKGSRGTDFQYLIRKILKNAKIKRKERRLPVLSVARKFIRR